MHKRFHIRMAIAGLAVLLTAGIGVSAPWMRHRESDVKAAIDKLVVAFNKGDVATFIKSCGVPTAITDDFAPHAWMGPTACADWVATDGKMAEADGITDAFFRESAKS